MLEQGPDLEIDAAKFAKCAGRDVRIEHLSGKKRTYETLTLPGTSIKAATDYRYECIEEEKKSDVTQSEANLPSIRDVESVAKAVVRRVLEYTIKNDGGYLSQASEVLTN